MQRSEALRKSDKWMEKPLRAFGNQGDAEKDEIPTVFFPAKTWPKQRNSVPKRTKMRQKAPKNHLRRRPNRLRINNLLASLAAKNFTHCKNVR